MRDDELEQWQQAGAHTYRCEREGVVFLRIVGDLAEGDVGAFFAAWDRLQEEGGSEQIFWLIDLASLGAISRGARQLIARTPVRPQNKGMAIFGASFQQRAIATLLYNAIALLQGEARPFAFLSSEAQARAWIAERRGELQGEPSR